MSNHKQKKKNTEILYYQWKKLNSDKQTSWVETTKTYYAEDYPSKWLIDEGWERASIGKTFGEI